LSTAITTSNNQPEAYGLSIMAICMEALHVQCHATEAAASTTAFTMLLISKLLLYTSCSMNE